MKYSSIIFDWDGTLAKTLHLWLAGYRTELKKLGYSFSDQLIVDDFFYEHDKATVKYPDINFDAFLEKVHLYVTSHVSTLETYTGVRAALERLLERNIKLALVSSSPRALLKEGLRQTGLVDFFPCMVAGDDVMRHKPDPEPFDQIVEIAKLDRRTTLVLGDSHNDMIAARAANIESCLFTPEENKLFYDFEKLKETNPLYCVPSLERFVDIITETQPIP